MKQDKPLEQLGPFVPWPHVPDDKARGPCFNPARLERGPMDHQADCQRPKDQAC